MASRSSSASPARRPARGAPPALRRLRRIPGSLRARLRPLARREFYTRAADRVLPHASRITRLTVAAVLAYLLAKAYTPNLTDLTGPLTALLVVQASLTHSVRSGIGRVASVLTGVLVASVLSIWVGLSWWSLGIAIFSALVLAYLLRLGDHILETPISAMLILGVGQHDIAAETRIANTLIGAAVGMTFNLAFPPPVQARPAQTAVRELAQGTARALHRAGDDLDDGLDRRQVEEWLRDIHEVLPYVAIADSALSQAVDSRRFNPRAMRPTDDLPVLRAGLVALDRSVLAVRQMLLSFQEEAPAWEEPDDAFGAELRRAFAVVLADMGDCIAAYGELTIAEATGDETESRAALAQTLEILRETQAILTELSFVDPVERTSTWLLRGSILAGVEQVLHELDVDLRSRREATEPVPPATAPLVDRAWLARHAPPVRRRSAVRGEGVSDDPGRASR